MSAHGGLAGPEEFVYSPRHGLVADIHRARAPDAPAALYLHGGGFQRGGRRDDPGRLSELAAHGLTIISIDYRLAPTWRYPAPVEDVRRAAEAVRERGRDLGLPTTALGVIGASAGGYLAAASALQPHAGARPFDAVSAWFAATDLVESTRRSPLEGRMTPVTYEHALLGEDADETRIRAASPAHWSLRDAPPFLLVHGDSDRIVPPGQSVAFHEALRRAGSDTTLVRLGAAGHEDPAFDGAPVLALVAGWMSAQLRAVREGHR